MPAKRPLKPAGREPMRYLTNWFLPEALANLKLGARTSRYSARMASETRCSSPAALQGLSTLWWVPRITQGSNVKEEPQSYDSNLAATHDGPPTFLLAKNLRDLGVWSKVSPHPKSSATAGSPLALGLSGSDQSRQRPFFSFILGKCHEK